MSIYKDELEKIGCFKESYPPLFNIVAESIPATNIPERMKLLIAVTEVMKFASNFRINMRLWNDSSIPINFIAFCIARSGVSKDSSISAAKKCFEDAYTSINTYRNDFATKKAIANAASAGKENYTDIAVYSKYMDNIVPLSVGVSTTEGLIQHLADLSLQPIGAGFMYSGEFGAELGSNGNMMDNIKAISELFDEGNKEVKIVKNKEFQTQEIKNFPMSALFVGSQDNLLYDENIKNKFKTEFATKLARRSLFIFVKETLKKPDFKSIEEMVAVELENETKAKEKRNSIKDFFRDRANQLLKCKDREITIDEEVQKLFFIYKKYNEELAEQISIQSPIYKISRGHFQWKALKIAGAIAMMDKRYDLEIKLEHYIYAIRFCELTSLDLISFEKEMNKESYEVFIDYMNTFESSVNKLSIHDLKKLGFLPKSGTPTVKLKELVQLANAGDSCSTYEIKNDTTVIHTKLVKTDTIHIAHMSCVGTKEERKANCVSPYKNDIMKFEDIVEVLKTDCAYSPFHFKNGHRCDDNVIGICNWLALDVDDSLITDKDAHIMFENVKHIIVRTSDKNNPYKFRLLIELDNDIDVISSNWTKLIAILEEQFAMKLDRLGKSSILFSYADSASTILTNFEAKPYHIKPILNELLEELKPKHSEPIKFASELLEDRIETFRYAYEARDGEGSRCLYRAAKHAKDLGADTDTILNLIQDINNYWVEPMSLERLERTILRQIRTWTTN